MTARPSSSGRRRLPAVAAALAVVLPAVLVTACGRAGPVTGSAGRPDSPPRYPAARDVSVPGSSVHTRAVRRGTIRVGVKSDHPFLGFEDPVTGRRYGFDIEIATMIAADLGFPPDRVRWQTVPPQARETALAQKDIDYYVAAYTINDERKKRVSFAGPYYVAGQDLLVRAQDTGIRGPGDVRGRRVCSVDGSTPYQRINQARYGARVVGHDSYAHCVQDLITGMVDAVTGDDAILKGYAAQNGRRLRVVGRPFSREPYGIGLAHDEAALRGAVNDALQHHMDNGDWLRAYRATLGRAGGPLPRPPLLRRY
ncbi:glutamate ABC transporter substrate-binding protein [Streptomyces sp. NPDC052309]|uniref:glutamate ABC transporter substrate-binding protein n=1 Tax=Streptomyces sp. NPDC052309 TaxID=3155421 RepID=UPI003432D1B4